MSQCSVFIIGYVLVKIAKKGSKITLHKGTTKLTESANIQKAMAIH